MACSQEQNAATKRGIDGAMPSSVTHVQKRTSGYVPEEMVYIFSSAHRADSAVDFGGHRSVDAAFRGQARP